MSKFTRYSSDTGKFLNYDENGKRIVDLEPELYVKAGYDVEIGGTKAPYEFHVYYAIHTEIAKFKARSKFTGYLRVLLMILIHKIVPANGEK